MMEYFALCVIRVLEKFLQFRYKAIGFSKIKRSEIGEEGLIYKVLAD
jgi:hypothetical protein